MYTKIAVVCTNPWETFLPAISQGNAKKYYEWLHKQAVLREENPYVKEKIAIYGDTENEKQEALFSEKTKGFQILYIQSKQEDLLEKVLNKADCILVGMPADRNECDKIFLKILPWVEKCILIWDGRESRGEAFYKKILSEYKLREKQVIEMNKLPSV